MQSLDILQSHLALDSTSVLGLRPGCHSLLSMHACCDAALNFTSLSCQLTTLLYLKSSLVKTVLLVLQGTAV